VIALNYLEVRVDVVDERDPSKTELSRQHVAEPRGGLPKIHET
jgi:hypothetical protein